MQKILIREYEDWKLLKRYRGLNFTVFNLYIAVKKMEKTLKLQSYLHVNRKKQQSVNWTILQKKRKTPKKIEKYFIEM